MKKIMMLCSMLAIAGFVSGCAGTKVAELKLKHFEEDEKDKIEAIGREYGEVLFEAIKTRDYEMFGKYLTPEAREAMTLKLFNESCEKLVTQNGDIGEATYLGNLRPNTLMRNFLWKIEFKKEVPKADEPSTFLIYDRLFNVSFVKIGEKYQIIGFHLM